MPDTIDEMNKKVARLIKEASEEEIAEILKSNRSVVRSMHVNRINNHREETDEL